MSPSELNRAVMSEMERAHIWPWIHAGRELPREGDVVQAWANGCWIPHARRHRNIWQEWGDDGFDNQDWVAIRFKVTHWMPQPTEPPP